jgi:hypothetical protein
MSRDARGALNQVMTKGNYVLGGKVSRFAQTENIKRCCGQI